MDGIDPTVGQPKQGRHTRTNTPVHAVSNQIVGYTDGGSRNTGNVTGGHVKDTDKAAWRIVWNCPMGESLLIPLGSGEPLTTGWK